MPDPAAILGGLAFLGVSGGLVYAGAVAGVVREALRPERKSMGWALARGLPSEPTAWGLPAREWTFEFEGARCPVFEIGSDDPAAPTAIVVHGFARSRYDSLARLGPLLAHGQRFLLPDLPGHGDASGRGTSLGTHEDRFIGALAAHATTGELLLMGHSLGATAVIHAATSDALRPRTTGVVALAPYERLRTPLGARLALRGLPRQALVPPALTAMGLVGVKERSTRESAARLEAPLVVLAGEADPVTPLEEARAIATAAPLSRFASIAHARHDDFASLGRDELVAGLAWLAHGQGTAREANARPTA